MHESLPSRFHVRKVNHNELLETPDNRDLISYLLKFAHPMKGTSTGITSCEGRSSPPSSGLKYYLLRLFSYPIDADIYSKGMLPPTHKLLLLSAVHLMVCGVGTDDNGDVTGINAGNALEKLVRNGVYRAMKTLNLILTRNWLLNAKNYI